MKWKPRFDATDGAGAHPPGAAAGHRESAAALRAWRLRRRMVLGRAFPALVRAAGLRRLRRQPARPWRQPRPGSVAGLRDSGLRRGRSEEHTSELQSLMRISYAVFCLKKKKR